MTANIRVRRVYEAPEPADGTRILVDRMWPRGLRREDARLDEWAKDIAPSAELRTWYAHDPVKASEFRRRYGAELNAPAARAALSRLRTLTANRTVTLLTATRDVSLSQAAVLAAILSTRDEVRAGDDSHAGDEHGGEVRTGGEERGGDAACWAHLVCPECGAVESEGHRPGCKLGTGGSEAD